MTAPSLPDGFAGVVGAGVDGVVGAGCGVGVEGSDGVVVDLPAFPPVVRPVPVEEYE